jgi:serine/threonine protein kinase
VRIIESVPHCHRETRRIKALTLAGVTLINQYMVLSYLGQGSSGRVYLCMDIHDSRLYAVKVGCGYKHHAVIFQLFFDAEVTVSQHARLQLLTVADSAESWLATMQRRCW